MRFFVKWLCCRAPMEVGGLKWILITFKSSWATRSNKFFRSSLEFPQ